MPPTNPSSAKSCSPSESTSHELAYLVAIDVGNTNTVFGLFDGDLLVHEWRMQTRAGQCADEIGVTLRNLFALHGYAHTAVRAAVIASVVPTVVATLREAMTTYFHVETLVIGPGTRTHMPILYHNPKEVGADRIVNAVAAFERYQQGLIIVDFGTATTFDVVSPRGEYMGGAIAPGIGIAADALFQRTAKLPRVELTAPGQALGRSTVTSIQAGLIYGYAGLVDTLVDRLRNEVDFTPLCIATGGLAPLMAQESRAIAHVEPHLTLIGLRLLWRRNASI